MANISTFKAQMQGGGARPNQFRIELTFPPFVGAAVSPAGNAASILCKSASLPASTIEDITAMYRGRPVHFAGERVFQPWMVSIYNDNNFVVRNALEKWSSGALTYTSTNGILRPADYQVDMSVHQLDRNDRVVKTYKFYDAYPVEIGHITLDYEDNNRIELFDVTFVYNFFDTKVD